MAKHTGVARKKATLFNPDFKKKKQKVGKKKPPPTSATNTSFKTRALVMPSQTITAEKGTEPVNSRQLTLKQLLTQFKHYSATTRKDAIAGLKDLVQRHPDVLKVHVGAILEALAELLTDKELPVRKSTVAFWHHVMPQLDPEAVGPFVGMIVVYLRCGVTHVSWPVRIDSLEVISLWMQQWPRLLAPHCSQLVGSFVEMLSRTTVAVAAPQAAGNNMTATHTKSPLEWRLQVLRSLLALLRAALPPQEDDAAAVGAAASEFADISLDEFNADQCRRYIERHEAEPPPPPTIVGLAPPGVGATSPDGTPLGSYLEVVRLAERLVPVLVTCWMEATPGDLSLPSPYAHLGGLRLILDVLLCLLRHLSLAGPRPTESDFLIELRRVVYPDFRRHFIAHFPFSPGSQSVEAVAGLNAVLARVCAFFLPLVAAGEDSEEWFDGLVDYLIDAMSGSAGQGTVDASSDAQVAASSHGIVAGLLPEVERLIPRLPSDRAGQLLEAFSKFDVACHPRSAAKVHCVRFLSRALQEGWGGSALAAEWLARLPKLLWQLQTHNLPATKMILETLIGAGRRSRPPRLAGDEAGRRPASAFEATQGALVPFFYTVLPPTAASPSERPVFGPFQRLPRRLQQLALDATHYYERPSPLLLRALAACCCNGMTADLVCHVLELVHMRREAIPLAQYASFVATVLFGISPTRSLAKGEEQKTSDSQTPDLSAAALVASSAARLLAALRLNVLSLLEPVLRPVLDAPEMLPVDASERVARFVAAYVDQVVGDRFDRGDELPWLRDFLPRSVARLLVHQMTSSLKVLGVLDQAAVQPLLAFPGVCLAALRHVETAVAGAASRSASDSLVRVWQELLESYPLDGASRIEWQEKLTAVRTAQNAMMLA